MDDYFAKLFAGHMGISAVLASVLVDKGVIGNDELSNRFRQAHRAAALCSSGPATAHALAEIIAYLERQFDGRVRPSAGRWALRSCAEARLLDAIDRRIEAFLVSPNVANQRQGRGRLAGNRMLPAFRGFRHRRPLPGPERVARGSQKLHRAAPAPGSRQQATRISRAPQPSFAPREPTAVTRVALTRNGVQHHRELPSSL